MAIVIMLTRLNGAQFAVNPDLLQRVEATPDTVLTLLDGTKYVVLEPVTTVIGEIRDYRASIIAAARRLEDSPRLVAVAEPPSTEQVAIPVPLRQSRRR